MTKGHDKGHKGQMSDRGAMKLALEALKEAQWFTGYAASGMTHAGWVTNNAKKADTKTEEAITALHQALEQPEQKPTVPDNMQDWANLDGDIALHLIERHADNWADIKKMMDEFVSAKIASAQSKHECETCANKRKRLEQSGFLKSPLRGEE